MALCDWGQLDEIIATGKFASGNEVFQNLKKNVHKSSVDDIERWVDRAGSVWEFLIGFAEIKVMYRKLIIQIFNKLTQVPGWVAVWRQRPDLHEKIQTLHEDLQAALAAQHEEIKKSVTPQALKSMQSLRKEYLPDHVRHAIEQEKIIDSIREEGGTATVACQEDEKSLRSTSPRSSLDGPLRELQQGIDAVADIKDLSDVERTNVAVDTLRIGCVRCSGDKAVFANEVGHAHQVFSFLFHVAREPDALVKVAEIVNILMASSWSTVVENSQPLRDALRDLPDAAQATLGIQSDKLLPLLSEAAREKASAGMVSDKAKEVDRRMQHLRTTEPQNMDTQLPPPPPPQNVWRSAQTPEGHVYYYNNHTKESVWERPAELGGPHEYQIGEKIEVWSNSLKRWGTGKVIRVANGMVTAEFTMATGAQAKKELPATHRDIRPFVAPVREEFSAEERQAYTEWFDAFPSADSNQIAVAKFLVSSGLERKHLKQIWAVANPSAKENISFNDFGNCCRLAAHCQEFGLESSLMMEAERPLRVMLRTVIDKRPPHIARFA